jgi:uncharacterized protein YjdB
MSSRPRSLLRVLLGVGLLVVTACGGGGGASSGGGDAAGPTKNAVAAPTGAVATNLQPQLNGWAFPNFPSATFPDLNFDTADLVSMFGSGPDVCVDGLAEPCTLTAEAAAWARMVNQARATGHCEGLVVLASARYNRAELPETVKLPSEEEEIRAVLRAFATQFVPEVQKSIEGWTKASLPEKIDELKRSFASDKLEYTLGVYVEGGGHAVLPYAIEYPTPDVARIMVYDSNWPGRNRYVDVDLANNKWSFSFAGDDPVADPNIWSGGSQDMDLTPFEARQGTCPFCGDGTKLQSTTLLVRTENLDWSVETESGAVSPTTPVSDDGSSARPVKGGVGITRLVPRAGERSSFDYLITIPNELLEGADSSATTAAGDVTPPVKKRAKLKFGGASSVFAVMKTGVAQFTTPGGGDDKPIELGTDSIKSTDPSVDLTLASGNLVANASGPAVELGSDGGSLAVQVTTANGEVIQQEVTVDTPAVQVKADTTGGVTVLEASSSGEVRKTDIASDGTKTQTAVDASALNLNKVEVELPAALESKPIAALPRLEDRNLSNPNYKADDAYVPPTTVASPRENATGPSTTVRGASPTTLQTRNAALPTTTTPRAVAAAGATPTTVVAVARPVLANFRIAARTFGDDAFTLDPPDSNSPGGFRYTSSRTEVATVNATTGRVTIVGAGTTTITATQAAARGFEAGTITSTLTVAKAAPNLVVSNNMTKNFGDAPFTIKDPTSDSTGAFTITSSDESVLRQSRTTGRWVIGGAGRSTIRVSQAATDDHLAVSDSFTVTVRKGTPDIQAPADVTKSFTDAEFDLPKPTSESRGAFTYTSSDPEVLAVTSTGRATIKSTGTVTITVAQATTDDWLAASATFKVAIDAISPTITEFADMAKTFGDDAFTLARPKSASPGAFTFSSSDEKVARVGSADGKVTIVGAGTVTITAKQATAKGYNEASATAKITVGKAAVTISDLLVADREFGAADFSLKPTSNSAGKFTYSTDRPDVFKVDEETGTVKIVGVGTATLTVKQAATANYEAGSASATVTVKKGTPTLTWEPGSKTFGDPEFELPNPASPSSGKFTFTVASKDSTRARINSSGRLVILRAGAVSLTATQASTNLWNEASVTGTLTIDKVSPTITGFTIPTKTYGDGPFSLTAPTSNSDGAFTYEIVPLSSSPLTPAVAAIQEGTNVVSPGMAGTISIRARQAATDNFTAGNVVAMFTLNKASQLSTDSPTFGFTPTSAVVSTPTALTLVGGAGSGEVTYSVVSSGTTQCTVSQDQQSSTWSIYATSSGTCSVRASKEGDRNYLPIESATTNVTVSNGQLTTPLPPDGASPTWFEVNEGGTITMTAPSGLVVTDVEFASYGTPNGSNGAYTTGNCHATSSQLKVEQALLGKSSGTINATNSVFGDPCGGTVKRLFIKVTYGAGVNRTGLISHLDASKVSSYPNSGTTWFDISGNGNNATLVGVTKNSAGYMTFSGANNVYANWGYPLASGSSYSIDAWVWRNSTNGAQNIASTDRSPFWFNNGPLCGGVDENYSVVCHSNVPINSWVHTAVTFDDAENVMKIYVNGVQVASNTTSLSFPSQWWTIGAHNGNNPQSGGWSNLNGRISSIRMYNRALTAQEIMGNYSATVNPA